MGLGRSELLTLVQHGYRFALALCHDEESARDLVQEAWCSVLKADGPSNRQYLFTAIRTRFVDQCRRSGRVGFEPLGLSDQEMAAHDCVESEPSLSAIALANGAFDSALGRLRAVERAVLYLASVEEFSSREIAELLDWPQGTVLSMVFRARKKLRGFVVEESESRP